MNAVWLGSSNFLAGGSLLSDGNSLIWRPSSMEWEERFPPYISCKFCEILYILDYYILE